MISQESIGQIVQQKMNLDVHPSLLESGAIVFMMNGDVQGIEGNNNSWFAQNQLGNELCYQFPENYVLKGVIKLNGAEQVLMFNTPDYDEIGILDTEDCEYTLAVTGDCFNWEDVSRVRGVYKFNNRENDRRIYFVDGVNPNKFLDIDKAILGDYPKQYTGSSCDSCALEEIPVIDCDKMLMTRMFIPPCVEIQQKEQGQLPSGVYQVGIALASDNLILSDFYFSPKIKAFSEASNISIEVNIDCQDNPFDQYSIILVSNTRENSLVVYNIGFFNISTTKLSITNTNNATILSTQQATQKRVPFDVSEHIVTNGEILMLGKHQPIEPLDYQLQALDIEIEWVEIKVPKKDAHKYPSFMRDEVYPIGLEWFGAKGNSRGKFHIPGRAPSEDDLVEYTGDGFDTNDIYEQENCSPSTFKYWQIENSAFITTDNGLECNNCSGEIENLIGQMGYWESQDFKYPNEERFGDLACQPIRHHRMPDHKLTHIHDNFTTEVTESTSGDCYEISVTDQDGNNIYTYEYCPSGEAEIIEGDCVNILTIRLKNITHPLKDGLPDPDISGYRVLVGDRQGNKSILHKGLLFNTWTDTSTEDTTIFYPNYPFNDLFPDVFLSTRQTDDNFLGTQPITNWLPPKSVQRQHFTYHSPDIHFREVKQEFGTEMKVYGESIGWIEGKFTNVYQHPQTRLGRGGITDSPYTNHAAQLNSVCHYSKFEPWYNTLFSRFEILTSQYLLPINQILSNGKKFNNYLRETSYYLEIGRTLTDPTNIDTSRYLASEFNGWSGDDPLPSFDYFSQVYRTDGLITDLYNPQGVSYYVGIKVKQPNQYGALDQISYRPVTCIIPIEQEDSPYESPIVYGGDVYITRHSTLRKMPLFTEWLQDVSIDTETNYRDFRNLWYPRFWYDNLSEADDEYNIDGFVDDDSDPGDILALGRFYLFVTGAIHYWCESEFIGDYREQDFTINGQFYPKVDFNEIARSDKIPYDNKYLYNLVFLNNELERVFQNLNLTDSDADFTVSYSLKNDFQSQDDKWLQFLPLNYTILPRIYGKFTGLHCTDDYSIFFAFENQLLYSQLNYSLNVNEGSSILLQQGDIFTNRLRKLSNEQTGYVGCVDPLSFVNTRYGTFFIDRYRKKVFLWSGTLQDVTQNMQSWLNEYLTFLYPGYSDLGVVSVFDNYTENVYFTGGGDREKWTISYKPKLQGFISFHSFTPKFYLTDNNTFLSTDPTNMQIWKHNKKGLYQEYYGEQVKFDIGIIINNKYVNKELQDIELYCEFFKIEQYGSNVYKYDKFFDKILAYNNNGSTGLMTTLLKNIDNFAQSLIQNLDTNNPLVIEITHVGDNIYRFNKFEDVRVDHNNQPLITLDSNGMDYTVESVDPLINPINRRDIRGKWIKLHLISEDNTDHKILVQLLIPNQHKIEI